MDHGDFEFPPDPAAEAEVLSSTMETINSIPLRVLSNMPIEQLPPTVVPAEHHQPIRQLMRRSRKNRRTALLQKETSDAAGGPAQESISPSQPNKMIKSAEPTYSPRSGFVGRKRARFDWSDEELRDFYEFLSQYGTDFNAIAIMYQNRSREDVKRLYHRELRKRRDDVRAALSSHKDIDVGAFRARLKKREELLQGPTRQLDQEEEEALRLIEAGTLKFQANTTEGEGHNDDATNDDFKFDLMTARQSIERETRPTQVKKVADSENSEIGDTIPPCLTAEEMSSTRNGGSATGVDKLLVNHPGIDDEPVEDDFSMD